MSKEFRLMVLDHLLETAPNQAIELFQEFCRLNNIKFSTHPINMIIDQATGFQKDIFNKFSFFVVRYVYLPLMRQRKVEIECQK